MMHADGDRSLDDPDVVVVGVSWRSASLADRERLAVPADRVAEMVDRMRAGDGVLSAVVLCTCNRTEVHVHATERGRAARTLRAGLARWGEMTPAAFESVVFEHRGERAVTHLLEVVSGFDSPADTATDERQRGVTTPTGVKMVSRAEKTPPTPIGGVPSELRDPAS
jgi:hypothetical protein